MSYIYSGVLRGGSGYFGKVKFEHREKFLSFSIRKKIVKIVSFSILGGGGGGYLGKVKFEHRKNSKLFNGGAGISEKSNLNIGKILSFSMGGYFGKVKFEHRKNSNFFNWGGNSEKSNLNIGKIISFSISGGGG